MSSNHERHLNTYYMSGEHCGILYRATPSVPKGKGLYNILPHWMLSVEYVASTPWCKRAVRASCRARSTSNDWQAVGQVAIPGNDCQDALHSGSVVVLDVASEQPPPWLVCTI